MKNGFSLLLALLCCTVTAREIPGAELQYLLSEISGNSAQTLALADGTLWQLSAPRALARGSAILISGRNLNTAAQARSGGFDFNVNFQNGPLKPQVGSRLTLLSQQQDGKRLLLSENLQAMVLDSDRLYSRHFQGSQAVIVSADGQQLIYLPSLTVVRIRLLQQPN